MPKIPDINEKFMKEAIRQAKKAAAIGDVPIGCVIVRDGEIIARGYNRRTAKGNVLQHAEIIAIDRACRKTGDWRLEECEMYVTLEPCPMCAGAIVQARIPRVYIGAMNPKAGCAGSVTDLFHMEKLNHQVEAVVGTCGDACAALMKDFFRSLREAHPKKVKYIPGEGRIER
ncbi:MAG: nucleoside deaminase [Lachnospiraceae bacterium]|nr:nucleoside deaminase [Lachnospiraceae bacterium]